MVFISIHLFKACRLRPSANLETHLHKSASASWEVAAPAHLLVRQGGVAKSGQTRPLSLTGKITSRAGQVEVLGLRGRVLLSVVLKEAAPPRFEPRKLKASCQTCGSV